MKNTIPTSALRARDALISLTRPAQVRTNQDTGLIRLIACICMFIDHAGKMLFPQVPEMRLIGRLAFPLFAYGVAVGAVYTKNPEKYLTRVVLLALISQPLYAVGLAHENRAMYAISFLDNPLGACWQFYINSWQKPSILLSLFLGLYILTALRKRQWILALFVYILCHRFSSNLDYGLGGIRLMILFYSLCSYPAAALAAICAYMIAWSSGSGYTFLGHTFGMRIFALPAVVFCCLPMKRRMYLPRWFVYVFYPAHLIVLAILSRLF